MAKQPIDVGAKFTADDSGFQKAAANVGKSAKAIKKDIREATGVFDELGGAIGGIGGEMTSMISSLATAATGIGAIVVVVGALAKAWDNSQKNIELYLKSADKLKAGSGGFTADADLARVDTRKRASGQVTLGQNMQKQNYAKAFGVQSALYSKDEIEYFKTLYAEGVQLEKNGKLLLESVRGLHDKTKWQQEYSKLLRDEETLNDESLANKTKWAELDAELVKNREIIADKDSTEKQKKDAVINAELLANQLIKEKNGFIDKQLVTISALAEMTETQEVVEGKIADLQREKAENTEKYYATLIKVDKMEIKSLKTAEDQLRIAKDFNTHNSAGYKISNIVASTKGIKAINFRSGKLTDGAPGIQSYGGLDVTEIANMIKEGKLTDQIESMQGIVGSLSSAFGEMFTSISSGSKTAFEDMAKAFARSLQQMAAQMAAKAATFAILNLITGGSMTAAKGGMGLLKFVTGSFANGTNFAPGGLSLVGERGPELVNLPRGSQVIPNGMGGSMRVEVVGKVSGRDLALVLSRYSNELMSNT
jgi:hypothetical protein